MSNNKSSSELQEEVKRLRLENKQNILFAQTFSNISSTFIGNTDIISILGEILNQIASFINSSIGILYLKYDRRIFFECFGVNKKNIEPSIFKDPLLDSDLPKYFPNCNTSLISNIKVGNKIIGQLVFINKEARNGTEEFNSLDVLLIDSIANQLVIFLKKGKYYRKQKDHLNLLNTVINSMGSSILAVNHKNEIILANSQTNDLFEVSGDLGLKNLNDILPKVSPLKNFIQVKLLNSGEDIPETLILSVSNPRLIRVNIAPLESKSLKGHVLVFEDVTELSKLKENFSKYVSSDLFEQMAKNNYRTRLGGENIVAAIFFSDIRGFTSLGENHSAEEIVDTLNQYYTLMIEIVYEKGGYVDKLVGDEIMAVFKSKDDNISPVHRAVDAALAMKVKMEYFNEIRIEQGLFTLSFGVGINFGEVIIGNIGSFNRMDYTIIGDNVNLAARLCSKAEPNQILISETAKNELGNNYQTRFIENFFAKGKTKPVKTFEIV